MLSEQFPTLTVSPGSALVDIRNNWLNCYNRTNSKELVGKTVIYAGYLIRGTPIVLNADFLKVTSKNPPIHRSLPFYVFF